MYLYCCPYPVGPGSFLCVAFDGIGSETVSTAWQPNDRNKEAQKLVVKPNHISICDIHDFDYMNVMSPDRKGMDSITESIS